MTGLRINDLKKSFDSTTVLDNISFAVSEGEFCILLGPSGCGKTTILRLIAGLEQQDKGEIYIGEQEVSTLTPKERNIAMVFQSYALYPHLNVYENMSFSLRIKKTPGHEIDAVVKKTADLLDIADLLRRKPKELSGGQRQRVAIGRAIVRNPSLFLFDEPLSNLDAKLRTATRVELAKLHRKLGSTIVYVTHDQTEAMTLGQKIILLNNGIIQQIGTPDDLYGRPANVFVAGFIGSPQMNFIEGSVVVKDEKQFFRSPACTIDISNRPALKDYIGKNIIMGIRPEFLTPDEGPLTARIELVEHLGSETIIYARAAGIGITARILSGFQGREGQDITFSFDNKGIHFFHNGIRIA
ncbi:MAG: ABC transporter ATP-binding protein [Nitrospiraceae bacterium]|nr:MAG: ABC transporter ATP-binding protein [Nitrospiraceae bacterium]